MAGPRVAANGSGRIQGRGRRRRCGAGPAPSVVRQAALAALADAAAAAAASAAAAAAEFVNEFPVPTSTSLKQDEEPAGLCSGSTERPSGDQTGSG